MNGGKTATIYLNEEISHSHRQRISFIFAIMYYDSGMNTLFSLHDIRFNRHQHRLDRPVANWIIDRARKRSEAIKRASLELSN